MIQKVTEYYLDENGKYQKREYEKDFTFEEPIENQIKRLKQQLQKYKEDVEQVELFGMERADYSEKKQSCASIVLQLRELENQLKED